MLPTLASIRILRRKKHNMLEAAEEDIGGLSDKDFRELIYRLAVAELESNGCPRSAVTAGGHQDAPDGGIDVRVECPSEIKCPDFVPRRLVGYQVKASEMPVAKIRDEMSPKGVLRESIRDILKASGAYVIVSSRETVTDQKLKDREDAMRSEIARETGTSSGIVRFYDKQSIVGWVNKYPGVVAWVRRKSGRDLSGWMDVEALPDAHGSGRELVYDASPIVFSKSHPQGLSLIQAVNQMRLELGKPRKCMRIVGLSGVGKTRLVKTLFDAGIGSDPLGQGATICADFGSGPSPSAVNMAHGLVNSGVRAFLIVDNCNSAAHSKLTEICTVQASKLSLITVEYDVKDDVPESTEVYTITGASFEVLPKWLSGHFPKLSEIDCRKISEFSGGNYRVAFAIAEKVREGETLGRLQARDLFERIFEQRRGGGGSLLKSARGVALLYSVDTRDDPDKSELAKLGAFLGCSSSSLHEDLMEMRDRKVLQLRGPYAAILPEAIANVLASEMLKSVQPGKFDLFCASLTPRMFKSLCRRLGPLHDSNEVREALARWLKLGGLLADVLSSKSAMENMALLAPVNPDLVLEKLEYEFQLHPGMKLDSETLHQCLWLIKQIAYSDVLFERAAFLYAKIISSQGRVGTSSQLAEEFAGFFHIRLSGTLALPDVRRQLIVKLSRNSTVISRECVVIALRAMLKTGSFTLFCTSGFGARSRGYGWCPASKEDVQEWYASAARLTVELAPEEARCIIAENFHGIWRFRESISFAAEVLSRTNPWTEGWMAALREISTRNEELSDADRIWLIEFAETLKPKDAVSLARAVVFNPLVRTALWEFDYDENTILAKVVGLKSNRLAEEAGSALAASPELLASFIPELMSKTGDEVSYRFGVGLSNGSADMQATWGMLLHGYASESASVRNVNVLCGFISGARIRDPYIVSKFIEAVESSQALQGLLIPLQASAGLDDSGIARLMSAIEVGGVVADEFWHLAARPICDSPVESTAPLINRVALMHDGFPPALRMIYTILSIDSGRFSGDALAVNTGRTLLSRVQLNDLDELRDYDLSCVVRCCLAGSEASEATRLFCLAIQDVLCRGTIHAASFPQTWKALLEVQPAIVLDLFLLSPRDCLGRLLFDEVSVVALLAWANVAPSIRYPLLAGGISMFSKHAHDSQEILSAAFVALVKSAPDPAVYLEQSLWGLSLSGWSGPAVVHLNRRKCLLAELFKTFDPRIECVASAAVKQLDSAIEYWGDYERSREERFE